MAQQAKQGRPIDPEKVKKVKVALVAAEGNVKKAAELAGVQPRTIQRYFDKGLIDPTVKVSGGEFLATVEAQTTTRNEKLADDMLSLAEQAVGQAIVALPDASAQQAATVFGIAVEKSRLLRGESTQKVDVNVSHDIDTLRRLGILVEAEPLEIIEGEVVE